MANKDTKPRARSARFLFYSIALGICWTLTVIVSLVWNHYIQHEETREVALNVARVYLISDNRYGRWNFLHGGIYVSADDESGRNAFPFEVKEPEIITPSGRKLVLTDHTGRPGEWMRL